MVELKGKSEVGQPAVLIEEHVQSNDKEEREKVVKEEKGE